MTLEEMLGRMSSAEFGFWGRFFQEQPFGEDRADHREANMAAAVCAALGVKVDPRKLIPQFGRRRTSAAELRAKLEALGPERFYGER